MNCPHCTQNGIWYEGRLERCWICGYWNDPKQPLRYESEGYKDTLQPRFQSMLSGQNWSSTSEYHRDSRHRCEARKRQERI